MTKKAKAQVAQNVCMSIGPWGATEIEQSYRKDIELVLSEVCATKSLVYKPFWDLSTADMPSGIFETLLSAKVVIADLRGLNPNVMYELGIRHAFNLPTILLKDSGTRLSWDIDKNFVLTYPLPIQLSHKQDIIDGISKQIDKVLAEDKKQNKVFSSFVVSVQRSASIESLNVDKDVKATLENLLNKVDRLGNLNGGPRIPDGLAANHLRAWDLVVKKGLSQTRAAEEMGLSQGRVSSLLQEYKAISGETD